MVVPFAAVIFDLDGTLVDSAPDIRAVLNAVLGEDGRPPLDLDAVIPLIGDGAGKLLERALAATGGVPEAGFEPLLRRFRERYDAEPAVLTRPYPRVPDVLASMQAAGVKLGICTNKPEAATLGTLEVLGLAGYFVAVVASGTLPGGVTKPDARMLQATLAALGIARGEAAVMVGDAINDVKVARNAGLPVVLRAGGYTVQPADRLGADAVFAEYSDLPATLRALAGRLSVGKTSATDIG